MPGQIDEIWVFTIYNSTLSPHLCTFHSISSQSGYITYRDLFTPSELYIIPFTQHLQRVDHLAFVFSPSWTLEHIRELFSLSVSNISCALSTLFLSPTTSSDQTRTIKHVSMYKYPPLHSISSELVDFHEFISPHLASCASSHHQGTSVQPFCNSYQQTPTQSFLQSRFQQDFYPQVITVCPVSIIPDQLSPSNQSSTSPAPHQPSSTAAPLPISVTPISRLASSVVVSPSHLSQSNSIGDSDSVTDQDSLSNPWISSRVHSPVHDSPDNAPILNQPPSTSPQLTSLSRFGHSSANSPPIDLLPIATLPNNHSAPTVASIPTTNHLDLTIEDNLSVSEAAIALPSPVPGAYSSLEHLSPIRSQSSHDGAYPSSPVPTLSHQLSPISRHVIPTTPTQGHNAQHNQNHPIHRTNSDVSYHLSTDDDPLQLAWDSQISSPSANAFPHCYCTHLIDMATQTNTKLNYFGGLSTVQLFAESTSMLAWGSIQQDVYVGGEFMNDREVAARADKTSLRDQNRSQSNLHQIRQSRGPSRGEESFTSAAGASAAATAAHGRVLKASSQQQQQQQRHRSHVSPTPANASVVGNLPDGNSHSYESADSTSSSPHALTQRLAVPPSGGSNSSPAGATLLQVDPSLPISRQFSDPHTPTAGSGASSSFPLGVAGAPVAVGSPMRNLVRSPSTSLSTSSTATGQQRYDVQSHIACHFLFRDQDFVPVRARSKLVRAFLRDFKEEHHESYRIAPIDSVSFRCILNGISNGYVQDCYDLYPVTSYIDASFGPPSLSVTQRLAMQHTTNGSEFGTKTKASRSSSSSFDPFWRPSSALLRQSQGDVAAAQLQALVQRPVPECSVLQRPFADLTPAPKNSPQVPFPSPLALVPYNTPAVSCCSLTTHNFHPYLSTLIVGQVNFNDDVEHALDTKQLIYDSRRIAEYQQSLQALLQSSPLFDNQGRFDVFSSRQLAGSAEYCNNTQLSAIHPHHAHQLPTSHPVHSSSPVYYDPAAAAASSLSISDDPNPAEDCNASSQPNPSFGANASNHSPLYHLQHSTNGNSNHTPTAYDSSVTQATSLSAAPPHPATSTGTSSHHPPASVRSHHSASSIDESGELLAELNEGMYGESLVYPHPHFPQYVRPDCAPKDWAVQSTTTTIFERASAVTPENSSASASVHAKDRDAARHSVSDTIISSHPDIASHYAAVLTHGTALAKSPNFEEIENHAEHTLTDEFSSHLLHFLHVAASNLHLTQHLPPPSATTSHRSPVAAVYSILKTSPNYIPRSARKIPSLAALYAKRRSLLLGGSLPPTTSFMQYPSNDTSSSNTTPSLSTSTIQPQLDLRMSFQHTQYHSRPARSSLSKRISQLDGLQTPSDPFERDITLLDNTGTTVVTTTHQRHGSADLSVDGGCNVPHDDAADPEAVKARLSLRSSASKRGTSQVIFHLDDDDDDDDDDEEDDQIGDVDNDIDDAFNPQDPYLSRSQSPVQPPEHPSSKPKSPSTHDTTKSTPTASSTVSKRGHDQTSSSSSGQLPRSSSTREKSTPTTTSNHRRGASESRAAHHHATATATTSHRTHKQPVHVSLFLVATDIEQVLDLKYIHEREFFSNVRRSRFAQNLPLYSVCRQTIPLQVVTENGIGTVFHCLDFIDHASANGSPHYLTYFPKQTQSTPAQHLAVVDSSTSPNPLPNITHNSLLQSHHGTASKRASQDIFGLSANNNFATSYLPMSDNGPSPYVPMLAQAICKSGIPSTPTSKIDTKHRSYVTYHNPAAIPKQITPLPTFIPFDVSDVTPNPQLFKQKRLSALDRKFQQLVAKFISQTLEKVEDDVRVEILDKMIQASRFDHYTFSQPSYIARAMECFHFEISNLNARDVDFVLVLDGEYLPKQVRDASTLSSATTAATTSDGGNKAHQKGTSSSKPTSSATAVAKSPTVTGSDSSTAMVARKSSKTLDVNYTTMNNQTLRQVMESLLTLTENGMDIGSKKQTAKKPPAAQPVRKYTSAEGLLDPEQPLGPIIPFPHHDHPLHPYYFPISALYSLAKTTPSSLGQPTSDKNMADSNILPNPISQYFKQTLRFGFNYKSFTNQNNIEDIIWIVKPQKNVVARSISKTFSFMAKKMGMKKDLSKLRFEEVSAPMLTTDDQQNEDSMTIASTHSGSDLDTQDSSAAMVSSPSHTQLKGDPTASSVTHASNTTALSRSTAKSTPATTTNKKCVTFCTRVDVNSVNDKPRFTYQPNGTAGAFKKGATNNRNKPTDALPPCLSSVTYVTPIDVNLHDIYEKSFVLRAPEHFGLGMNYICFYQMLESIPFAIFPRSRLPLHDRSFDGFGLDSMRKERGLYQTRAPKRALPSSRVVLERFIEGSNNMVLLQRKRKRRQRNALRRTSADDSTVAMATNEQQ